MPHLNSGCDKQEPGEERTLRPYSLGVAPTETIYSNSRWSSSLAAAMCVNQSTRQHDDDLVAGVGGFADQAAVVRGFARLHVTHHQPTPIPHFRDVAGPQFVSRNVVCDFVYAVNGGPRDTFLKV